MTTPESLADVQRCTNEILAIQGSDPYSELKVLTLIQQLAECVNFLAKEQVELIRFINRNINR